MSRPRMILWAIIIGLLVAVCWLLVDPTAPFGRSTVFVVSRTFAPIVQPIVQQFPFMQFGTLSQPTTVLFMGTDVVYTDSRRRQADRQALTGNSDTMMLVFLNPTHNTVSVINIPRDTEANVGRYGVRKINSANLLGGPELARETVAQLLEVSVDHYVVMNIQGLVEMVNELGGVTIEIRKKMNYMDWTGKLKIDLEPGVHTLTGNQAMGFVRFRHDSMGDIGRIQRQQIFLNAAFKKMLDPKSWLHLNNLIEIARRNIQTDMSDIEMLQALNFAHAVPKDSIKFVMLPGGFADNGDWIANTDGRELARQFANPDYTQEVPRSRRNITVCIINASSDEKLGGRLSMALRELGYRTCVGKSENEPSTNRTRIIAQVGNVADARMMQQDLGAGEVINASVGNLMTSLTIVAHDDINFDQIKMSSADAEYVKPYGRPQPLVVKPLAVLSSKRHKQGDMLPVEEGLQGMDEMPSTSSGSNGTPEMNSTESNALETFAPENNFAESRAEAHSPQSGAHEEPRKPGTAYGGESGVQQNEREENQAKKSSTPVWDAYSKRAEEPEAAKHHGAPVPTEKPPQPSSASTTEKLDEF